MHVVIAFICSLLYCVTLPAYSMCWPVFGLQRIMLQTFQTTSKDALGHALSLSDAVGVDGLTLSSKPSAVIDIRWP